MKTFDRYETLADLGGDNALENVELSAIVEVCEDLWTRMTTIFWQSNETVKTEAKRMFKESYLPVALSKLEKQIATNKSDSGWICSNKVISCSTPYNYYANYYH